MQYNFPDIERVAYTLKVSTRSLQRQLSVENTSFTNILLQTKIEIAKALIQQNHLTISETAYTLGYSDIGNFSRSLKKHTGFSPQEYRNQCAKKS